MDYVSVNLIIFLFYLIRYWFDPHQITKALTNRYQKKNFKINFFLWNFWIVQEEEHVKNVLSSDGATQMTWANASFFSSHPYTHGIGNINYKQGPCEWQAVHQSLAKSIDLVKLKKIMDKHAYILFRLFDGCDPFNDILEIYLKRIWGEYTFGSHVDHHEYHKLQQLLIDTLRLTFYNHQSWIMIPIFGSLMAKLYRWWYTDKFAKIDRLLDEMLALEGKEDSFFGKFRQNLETYQTQHPEVNLNADKLVKDNAFLSPLVFDFLYLLLMEAMIRIAKEKIDDPQTRKDLKNEFLSVGFLFPFRFRRFNQDCEDFKNGDFVIVDLVKSKLLFSSGPRGCIGPGFVGTFYTKFMETLAPFQIREKKEVIIVRKNDPNVPLILSEHVLELSLPRDYLKNNMPHHKHKGVPKFWDTNWIDRNPAIKAYVISFLAKYAKDKYIDAIITPDARGFLFGACLQEKLGLPVYVVRKEGKLPGPVYRSTVSGKKYDDPDEILEITQVSLVGKKVVVVDDGVASGATLNAIDHLVIQTGGIVDCVLVAMRHTYTNCEYDGQIISVFDL